MQEKRRQINFRLSRVEMEYLNDAADHLGLSKTAAIRVLLREFNRRIAAMNHVRYR